MGDIIIPKVFANSIEDDSALVAFMKPDAFNVSEFQKVVKEGSVIAVDDDKNLPIYPSMRDFITDVIESDFNPDIDRTLHFTSEDLNNIIVWKCKPLGDVRDTAHDTIKLAYAIMLLSPMNMDQIRADIKLTAASMGLTITYKEEDTVSDIAATILEGVRDSNGLPNIPNMPNMPSLPDNNDPGKIIT